MPCLKSLRLAILNLKTTRDKCPPPIRYLNKTDLKVGDMELIKNLTPVILFSFGIYLNITYLKKCINFDTLEYMMF